MKNIPFVLPVKTALGHYIYEVNKNEILFVDENIFQCVTSELLNKSDEAVEEQLAELKLNGYLSSHKIKHIQHSLSEISKILLDRGINQLILQVTQECNLRCKYCIYSENSNVNQRMHTNSFMTLETAKKAIDFYRIHSIDADRAVIGFYGGEPFLNFDLIKKAVEYAEIVFEGKEIVFTATSNATLLSDQIIEFIMQHNFQLTISIDGPKELHDKNRVFASGKGTYDKVIANIHKINKKNSDWMKNVSFSLVVDNQNDFYSIKKILDDPVFQKTKFMISYVEKDGKIQQPSNQYLTQYNYESFLSIVRLFRGDWNRNREKFTISNESSLAFEDPTFSETQLGDYGAPNGPCVPGKLRLFVDTEGNLYSCERVNENKNMCIGTLKDGFNVLKIYELLNISQIGTEECRSCWAFSLCGICAKWIDDGEGMSIENRKNACQNAKTSAYGKILRRILVYENSIYQKLMREIISKGENV